jgi:hypothetical protein
LRLRLHHQLHLHHWRRLRSRLHLQHHSPGMNGLQKRAASAALAFWLSPVLLPDAQASAAYSYQRTEGIRSAPAKVFLARSCLPLRTHSCPSWSACA